MNNRVRLAMQTSSKHDDTINRIVCSNNILPFDEYPIAVRQLLTLTVRSSLFATPTQGKRAYFQFPLSLLLEEKGIPALRSFSKYCGREIEGIGEGADNERDAILSFVKGGVTLSPLHSQAVRTAR